MVNAAQRKFIANYIYGRDDKPQNLIDPLLINRAPIGDDGEFFSRVELDAVEFMTSGGGRFAKLSQAAVVENFFTAPTGPFINPEFLPTGQRKEFSLSQIREIVSGNAGSDGSGREVFDFQQYSYGADDEDYLERVFYYNSTSFTIRADEPTFVIDENGNRFIENARVLPFNDNFDFQSDNPIASLTGPFSRARTDPSNIGGTVQLVYDDTVENISFSGTLNEQTGKTVYSSNDFLADQAFLSSQFEGVAIGPIIELAEARIVQHLQDLLSNI